MPSVAPTLSMPASRTTERHAPRRLAWLFSFPALCMVLLAAVLFGFSVKQFAEPDIWWHLRSAQELLQTHNFVPPDTYSFTAAGSVRPNYEWLSEVVYLAAFLAMGLRGILAVYFAVLVLTFAGVYRLSCNAGADCKNAAIATLIGIFLGVVSIGPRTLLFGWLCMIGLLLTLDRFRRTGKSLWLLPPLFALWINLHPSWVFGFAVLVLTIGAGLVQGEWGFVVARKWSKSELGKLALALVAPLAAMLLNPLGYKLLLYPFDFLFRQQSNVQYIAEWQSLDFSSGDGKFAMLVILGLIAACLLSRREWRLDEVLLTVFALAAALLHARFLFFAGLVLPSVFAQRLALFPPYDRKIDKPILNGGIMLAVVVAMAVFFPSNASLQRDVDHEYPAAALRFIEQQQLTGNVFNQYVWGGYMEWFAPHLKTFIDGRADIFVYNGVLDDHRKMTSLESPLEVLDKYHINYALLQPERPLTYFLAHSPGWRPVYEDKVAVIFQRDGSAAGAASTQ